MTRRVIRGGLVLASAGDEPVRADVLVDGTRIARVASSIDAGHEDEVLDARDQLVMPGLINTHTHAHNNIAKGAIDGHPLEIWLQYLFARVRELSPRDIYVGTAVGAIEMARTGTTCALDMAQVSPWPTEEKLDAVFQAYADVGLRVSCAAQMADQSFADWAAILDLRLPADVREELIGRETYPVEEVLATLERTAERWEGSENGRIRFGVGPAVPTICSDKFLEACGQLAHDRNLSFQTHLVETRIEAHAALERFGVSAVKRLAQVGLLGPRTLLAHAVWLTDADIDLIAETGATVSHNPMSNLKLGSGVAPVLELRRRGGHVALGTDGSASSDNQNMFGPLRCAAILHRVSTPDYGTWLTSSDVLEMATVNGARAPGLEGEVGRVAEGYAADLSLVDLRSSYFRPRNDIVNQLVHCEVGSSVSTVLVNGEIIVDVGRMTRVDEGALYAEYDEIAERVASSLDPCGGLPARLEPHLRDLHLSTAQRPWPRSR